MTRHIKDEKERSEIRASAAMDRPAFFAGPLRPLPGIESSPLIQPPPPVPFGFTVMAGHEQPPSSKTTDSLLVVGQAVPPG